MSRCACGLRIGIRNVTCAYVRRGAGRPSEQDREASRINRFRTAPGRVVWRRKERDLQVVEEVSVVFSNIEVRVKRGGPSGLGDLEVTEYITRIRSEPFERKDGTTVHLATTEARFKPPFSVLLYLSHANCI